MNNIIKCIVITGLFFFAAKLNSQVIFNVTSSSFGPGPGTFATEFNSALNAFYSGQHAIVNVNASGLITTPFAFGYLQSVANVTGSGTLTIRKDPSLPVSNQQGFKAFNPNQNFLQVSNDQASKVEIVGLTFKDFAYCLWYTYTSNCLLADCVFLDNVESVHTEACSSMTVTNNIMSESAGNPWPLSCGIHVFCYDNDIEITDNHFSSVNTSVNNYSGIFINHPGASLPVNSINLKIDNNTFNNNKNGIYSFLNPANNQFNNQQQFIITNNKFNGNIDQISITNPSPNTVLDNNIFSSSRDNDLNLQIHSTNSSATNNYGLNLISNNSLGVSTTNANNIFNGSAAASYKSIRVFGNPANPLLNFNEGINVIGQHLPGRVTVAHSVNTNLLENEIKTNVVDLPIDQIGFTQNTSGNIGIASAIVSNAQVSGNQLSVGYHVNGFQHLNQYCPLDVEFFECNQNGEVLSFIGRNTVQSISQNLITTNFNLNNPLSPFCKLGVIVTSKGTGSGTGIGSSEVAYFNLNLPVSFSMTAGSSGCVSTPLNFSVSPSASGVNYTWDFGDGSFGNGAVITHNYNFPGTYNITVSVSVLGSTYTVMTQPITVNACAPPQICTNCIGSFAPDPGEYMLSVWVREDITPQPISYNNAQVQISFTNHNTVYNFVANPTKNKIIEGWQRIEEPFSIPFGATHLNLRLWNAGGTGSPDAFFDDIRIFPKDGQIKTYVYDPLSLRLSAVLDENNYATFYEYDEEGKLIRIKKETEKGIMTIQESREGLKKQ